MRRALTSVFLCVFFALPAESQPCTTVTASLDNGNNSTGWTFGGPSQSQPLTGGNPGGYVRTDFLDTFAPQPHCANNATMFTGDYWSRSVSKIGVDLQTFRVDFGAGGRPLSVLLMCDNGTPADSSDDYAAYYIGIENVPIPGEGWKRFEFAVPSRSASTPPGWDYIQFGPNAPSNPDWQDVLRNVTQLRFFYGNPTFFFIFQTWDLGIDNPMIRWCDADANSDGITNFADLNIVLSEFGQNSPLSGVYLRGDVNNDGVVNFADLNIILSAY
ncbi:MAG: hypothetical protein AB7G17_09605 [Phycisphaerales bacterium]